MVTAATLDDQRTHMSCPPCCAQGQSAVCRVLPALGFTAPPAALRLGTGAAEAAPAAAALQQRHGTGGWRLPTRHLRVSGSAAAGASKAGASRAGVVMLVSEA